MMTSNLKLRSRIHQTCMRMEQTTCLPPTQMRLCRKIGCRGLSGMIKKLQPVRHLGLAGCGPDYLANKNPEKVRPIAAATCPTPTQRQIAR
jgi:hypothetical protein